MDDPIFEYTLDRPLTMEELSMVCDSELEHTPKITIKTPSGREVVFVKTEDPGQHADAGFGKWTPTSERLPTIGDSYLVTVYMRTGNWRPKIEVVTDVASSHAYGSITAIDNFWEPFHDWYEGQDEIHVTAWMQRPKPYADITHTEDDDHETD